MGAKFWIADAPVSRMLSFVVGGPPGGRGQDALEESGAPLFIVAWGLRVGMDCDLWPAIIMKLQCGISEGIGCDGFPFKTPG